MNTRVAGNSPDSFNIALVGILLATGGALAPGEGVNLEPNHWHAFLGGGGDVLIGEVSNVNDDLTDNIFNDPIGRFSQITENEDPLHLLVSDYDNWLK